MANNKKIFTIKVWSMAKASYKGAYSQYGEPVFSENINGGQGELTFTIPRKQADLLSLAGLDEFEYWVQDNDSAGNGVLIYSGFVIDIESNVGTDDDNIVVRAVGHVARLGMTFDSDASADFLVQRNSNDPATAVKDVIDKFNANFGGTLTYTAGTSVVNVGSVYSYGGMTKYCTEIIDRWKLLAGANYYWFVDQNKVFYFKPFPTTPTHVFIFGKDITSIKTSRKYGNITNSLYFWNSLQVGDTNLLSKLYTNAVSATAYYTRHDRLTDARYTDATSALALATAIINANKNPVTNLTFTVKDNNFGQGYDIESIKVGDTCQILGVEESVLYSTNMVIEQKTYKTTEVELVVSPSNELTSRKLTDLRKSLDNTVYSDGVSTMDNVSV